MNTLELTKYIGRIGLLADSRRNLQYTIRITDARESYGRVQYFVTPLSGQGSVWVDGNLVVLDEVPA